MQQDYDLTIEQYKDWLRKKPGHPFISTFDLTPVLIEIAAYTLGVRIALFIPRGSPNQYEVSKMVVDKFGRVVPDEDSGGYYFGPSTLEVLFMAVESNQSYFALFPKITKRGQDSEEIQDEDDMLSTASQEDFMVMSEIDSYWKNVYDRDAPN